MSGQNAVEHPLRYAREVVGCDPFATFLGIEVEEVQEGYARCSITIQPEHLNAVERAHGAFIYALADQAFAVACNSTGVMAIAVTVTIHYLASSSVGEKIFAEAMPVNIGRKVSVWRIEVRATGDRLIASATGTAYHR